MERSRMVEQTGLKNMLVLSQDGVFPITKDKNGHSLSCLPASELDVPGTIQGEGKLNGIPSLFIRLAGCNLHCCWNSGSNHPSPCDTAYAAYATQITQRLSSEDIFEIICQNAGKIKHVVITGGEPLLQAKELTCLCQLLKQAHFHLTLETNATLYDETLAKHIDLFSLSPKLASSTPIFPHSDSHDKIRINLKTIQNFIDHSNKYSKDFQLKFVCASDGDIPEIQAILSQLKHWKNEDILLMPLGGCEKEMRSNMYRTLEHCIRNGWRYCDRLHISLFGAKQGV